MEEDTSKPAAADSPRAEMPADGSTKKGANENRTLWILVLVAGVLLLVLGGILAWIYFTGDEETPDESGGSTGTELPDDLDKDSETDRELFDTDEEDTEDGDADEFEAFPGMFDEDSYTTRHFVCDGYAGEPEDQYYYDVWYPTDYVTLQPGPGYASSDPDCDIELVYEDTVMSIRYNVGEAYLGQIGEGYEVLKEKDGKTMVRTDVVENGGEYVFSYVWKVNDLECVPGDFNPTLAPPCAHGVHPFMPPATMVQVVAPGDTGASVLSDIVELFDDIAMLMEGGEVE